MRHDTFKRRLLQFHLRPRRDDMGQNNLSSGGTVGIHRTRATAHQIDKTMQLRLGMMKAARTGPAVGPPENRGITVFIRNTPEFISR